MCVGLDPAPASEGLIPGRFFENSESEREGLEKFCLGIIEKTAEHACAIKVNAQYALPFSLEQHRWINESAHGHGLVSILDAKLGDIGSSNRACMHWCREAGYDALTFSPFAGNLREAQEDARKNELGLFVLTLMSNPEAKFFMRESSIGGKPGYEWIAEQIGALGIEGAVVGATHTSEEELKKIRALVGEKCVMLVPGVGAQGGDAEKMMGTAGENLLVNVARGVIYAGDPAKAAREFSEQLKWGRK